MNQRNYSRRHIGRYALEIAALKAVCACQYYDLQDNLAITTSLELLQTISQSESCPCCGRKGA